MTFSPVKSDPWKKGMARKSMFQLWPSSFWTELVEMAGLDTEDYTEKMVESISSMNRRLYGDKK